MSPPTWTPGETSDSSLWSQLQQLSKIVALTKMASHPSLDRRPSLPIMPIWAPGGQQGRGLGGRGSEGVSVKSGDEVLLRLIVAPGMSLLISVNWPHSLPLTSLSKPNGKNLGARA